MAGDTPPPNTSSPMTPPAQPSASLQSSTQDRRHASSSPDPAYDESRPVHTPAVHPFVFGEDDTGTPASSRPTPSTSLKQQPTFVHRSCTPASPPPSKRWPQRSEPAPRSDSRRKTPPRPSSPPSQRHRRSPPQPGDAKKRPAGGRAAAPPPSRPSAAASSPPPPPLFTHAGERSRCSRPPATSTAAASPPPPGAGGRGRAAPPAKAGNPRLREASGEPETETEGLCILELRPKNGESFLTSKQSAVPSRGSVRKPETGHHETPTDHLPLGGSSAVTVRLLSGADRSSTFERAPCCKAEPRRRGGAADPPSPSDRDAIKTLPSAVTVCLRPGGGKPLFGANAHRQPSKSSSSLQGNLNAAQRRGSTRTNPPSPRASNGREHECPLVAPNAGGAASSVALSSSSEANPSRTPPNPHQRSAQNAKPTATRFPNPLDSPEDVRTYPYGLPFAKQASSTTAGPPAARPKCQAGSEGQRLEYADICQLPSSSFPARADDNEDVDRHGEMSSRSSDDGSTDGETLVVLEASHCHQLPSSDEATRTPYHRNTPRAAVVQPEPSLDQHAFGDSPGQVSPTTTAQSPSVPRDRHQPESRRFSAPAVRRAGESRKPLAEVRRAGGENRMENEAESKKLRSAFGLDPVGREQAKDEARPCNAAVKQRAVQRDEWQKLRQQRIVQKKRIDEAEELAHCSFRPVLAAKSRKMAASGKAKDPVAGSPPSQARAQQSPKGAPGAQDAEKPQKHGPSSPRKKPPPKQPQQQQAADDWWSAAILSHRTELWNVVACHQEAA
ncbi:hypothetical protein DIPPA_10594 [Diplonema papillatum]|nr:hypothetical protein DIPPA_10594 [Diplonema papillatum]